MFFYDLIEIHIVSREILSSHFNPRGNDEQDSSGEAEFENARGSSAVAHGDARSAVRQGNHQVAALVTCWHFSVRRAILLIIPIEDCLLDFLNSLI